MVFFAHGFYPLGGKCRQVDRRHNAYLGSITSFIPSLNLKLPFFAFPKLCFFIVNRRLVLSECAGSVNGWLCYIHLRWVCNFELAYLVTA